MLVVAGWMGLRPFRIKQLHSHQQQKSSCPFLSGLAIAYRKLRYIPLLRKLFFLNRHFFDAGEEGGGFKTMGFRRPTLRHYEQRAKL